MAVRNFWIDANIDGRRTRLRGGPRGREGGFDLAICQRARGQIVRALEVAGECGTDGTLRLRVFDREGRLIENCTTTR